MITELLKKLPATLPQLDPCPKGAQRDVWQNIDESVKTRFIKNAKDILPVKWSEITITNWLEYYRSGDRQKFGRLYFTRRSTLATLVCAECVEYNGTYLEEILKGIFIICEESAWQKPAHNTYIRDTPTLPLPDVTRPIVDLFAAETGALIAMTMHLLSDELEQLAPGINARMQREIEKRIVTPYLTEHFWWMGDGEGRMNNWTSWCTQNVLLTVFITQQSEKIKRQTIEKAAKSLDYFLEEYTSDGGCDEGAQYYKHAGLTLWGALKIMNEVAPSTFASVFKEEKIKNIAEFVANMHVNDEFYFNFGDCSCVAGRRGAREYLFGKDVDSKLLMAFAVDDLKKDPDPDHVHSQDGSSAINLWYRIISAFTQKEMLNYKEKYVKNAYVYYPKVGLFILRKGNYDFCAKAGCNGDSHNHNDSGSFILYKNGKPFIIDIGVETYTKKTFGPQRYEIWTMQSSWHNLPTFNGAMQLDGCAYTVSDITCDENTIEMELSTAYPKIKGLSTYKRKMEQKETNLYLKDVTDYINPVELTIMTEQKPLLQNDVLQIGELGSIAFAGGNTKITITEVPITDARLATAWKNNLYKITFTFEKEIELTFT